MSALASSHAHTQLLVYSPLQQSKGGKRIEKLTGKDKDGDFSIMGKTDLTSVKSIQFPANQNRFEK